MITNLEQGRRGLKANRVDPVRVVIGVDDIHPESSADGVDCGGDLEHGALGLLSRFMERYSRVRFTLFVTPDWRRTGGEHVLQWVSQNKSFRLDLPEYDDFRSLLRRLHSKGAELGLHGLTHLGNDPIKPDREFQGLAFSECLQRINDAIKIIRDSNLPTPTSFVPPAWGTSDGLFSSLASQGMKFVSASYDSIHDEPLSNYKGLRGVSNLVPQEYQGVLNIPRNMNFQTHFFVRRGYEIRLNWSMERIRRIVDAGGIISFAAHIENEYSIFLGNGITRQNMSKFEKILELLEKNYGQVEYRTFSELGEVWLKEREHPQLWTASS